MNSKDEKKNNSTVFPTRDAYNKVKELIGVDDHV